MAELMASLSSSPDLLFLLDLAAEGIDTRMLRHIMNLVCLVGRATAEKVLMLLRFLLILQLRTHSLESRQLLNADILGDRGSLEISSLHFILTLR